MIHDARFLLPSLPPELRNEVYKQLSRPDSTSLATTAGLPLQLQIYKCKHTVTHIYPVHYDATSLLALRECRFQEAHEYYSWLVDHALELRIRVKFQGRIDHFVQAHWDQKMETHLRKLAKRHPWLMKVGRYDIQVHWDAKDGIPGVRETKRTPGLISRKLAETLTLLMEQQVRHHVKISLYLECRIAVQYVTAGFKFGFEDFFLTPSSASAPQLLALEIWTLPCTRSVQPAASQPSLPVAFMAKAMERPQIIGGVPAEWTLATDHMLMRKIARSDGNFEVDVGACHGNKNEGMNYVLATLVEECTMSCRPCLH